MTHPPLRPIEISVSVSNSGFGISSLKAEDGTELLAGPIGMVAIADTSDTWAHGINEFRQEMGRPTLVSSTVIENGPVTRVTRQRASWQDSEIVLDIAEFAGLDFVELRFVIDWHEHEQMLKLEIPTALAQPKIFAKVPGQVLERTTNGEEEPYQDWAAVQGKIGNADYTVALLNNSTYSYDCLHSLFRTVLIRSAPFARHNPNQVPHNDNNAWQDQGRQERTFWLMGGRGGYAELSLDRRAEELADPGRVCDGLRAPRNRTMGAVLPRDHAEQRLGVGDQARRARRRREPFSACRSDREKQPRRRSRAPSLGLDHTIDLAPWELKTLLVTPAKTGRSQVKEVSLLEV